MRVNVYAEELTDRVELITKTIEGQTFTAVRFYLELPASFQHEVFYKDDDRGVGERLRPATIDDTAQARQMKAPFIHHPGDDDSSAITFWGKRDLRPMLQKALDLLDNHFAQREATKQG
jgi:hypothetical protein